MAGVDLVAGELGGPQRHRILIARDLKNDTCDVVACRRSTLRAERHVRCCGESEHVHGCPCGLQIEGERRAPQRPRGEERRGRHRVAVVWSCRV